MAKLSSKIEKVLSPLLSPGEQILDVGNFITPKFSTWYVGITNKRVIFIPLDLLWGRPQLEQVYSIAPTEVETHDNGIVIKTNLYPSLPQCLNFHFGISILSGLDIHRFTQALIRAQKAHPSYQDTPLETAEPMTVPPSQNIPPLEKQVSLGISWFYWIAGPSALNSVLALISASSFFSIGLGITILADVVAKVFSDRLLAFTISLLISGMFALFGFLGQKGKQWAILLGMALYALDTLLVLFLKAWIGVIVHLLALAMLWSGWKALKAQRALRKEATETADTL